jgi:hypothetical protein
MMQSVEGDFRDGKVELFETPPDVKGARVIVTFLPPREGPINLRALGISEIEAGKKRQQFETIADDWERPEMDVYDDYFQR